MAERWRLTTWNLHGSAEPPLHRIAAVVRDLAPDVLVLQEVRRAQCRQLAAALGWNRTWHRKHHPYTPFVWWRTEGMAIVSPHRLVDSSATSLTPDESTWVYRHRIAVQTVAERADGATIRVIDLHLASEADLSGERVEQAHRARRLMEVDTSPSVVAGDFNDHGDEVTIDVLAASTHADAWDRASTRPAGDGSTNPSHEPTQRLDRVLVPRAATDVTVELPDGGDDWAELSDHLPLTVAFSLPGQIRSQ